MSPVHSPAFHPWSPTSLIPLRAISSESKTISENLEPFDLVCIQEVGVIDVSTGGLFALVTGIYTRKILHSLITDVHLDLFQSQRRFSKSSSAGASAEFIVAVTDPSWHPFVGWSSPVLATYRPVSGAAKG